MFGTPEFKVGLMVIVVSTLIGGMSMKVTEGPGVLSGSNEYWFELEDAGGLIPNGAVKVAGIKVGIIRKIDLVNGKAHVHLVVDDEVKMHTSGTVKIKADGILGDKHVELITGLDSDPVIADGTQIMNSDSSGSIGNLVNEVGKVTNTLGEVAENLKKATGEEGDNSTVLGRIVGNIEQVTADLAQMTGNNKDRIDDIVERIQGITQTLDEVINDDGEEGFRVGWKNAMSSMRRLDKTLKNMEDITTRINNGEGTIGRLVNDEETIEEINTAVHKVNDFLGGADEMATSIDYHAESLSRHGLTKSYLNFKIQPGPDRFYEIGIVDDPRGVENTTNRDVTTGGTTTSTKEVTNDLSDIKFNVLFAKVFHNLTIRGGIMESSGGVGLDYGLFRNKLKLSVEAFEFDDLHVRAFARYNFFKGIYVVGGGDDVFDSTGQSSAFFGAGIFITNDDLKILASKVSF